MPTRSGISGQMMLRLKMPRDDPPSKNPRRINNRNRQETFRRRNRQGGLEMRGYAEKFLEIDLSAKNIKEIKFPEEILRSYIGGRGLATKILWDRLGRKWETINPLGPENILLVLTGPLTGYFPGTKVAAKQWSNRLNPRRRIRHRPKMRRIRRPNNNRKSRKTKLYIHMRRTSRN